MRILVCLAILGLTSCGINQSRSYKNAEVFNQFQQKHQLKSQPKITSFHFQDWQSLDNDHLIISTKPGESYLISLQSYCYDLKFAKSIIIKRRLPSVLNTKYDSIIVPNNVGAYCFIDKIQAITTAQINELSSLVKHTP